MSIAAPAPRVAVQLADLGPVAQLRAGRLPRRLVQLYVGLYLYGVSLALMVLGDIGLAPWDVLHSGFIRHVPITLGQAVVLFSFVVLVLWIPLREKPGLGTISNAIVVGFNVRPDRNAAEMADREAVDIRLHSVIYNVTEEIKKGMEGMLEPTYKEVRLGAASVREVFKVPKVGAIAGCLVTDGRITRAGETTARLVRDNVVIHEGRIGSLRRFKDDVSEVKSGFECGIGLDRFNDIKTGDVIEVFTMERVKTASV